MIWERILVDYPTDMLSLKFAHDCYFYLGRQTEIRDSIARVLPVWSLKQPLYGYLMGMYSFGLCETSRFEQAEQYARKVIDNIIMHYIVMYYISWMLVGHELTCI